MKSLITPLVLMSGLVAALVSGSRPPAPRVAAPAMTGEAVRVLQPVQEYLAPFDPVAAGVPHGISPDPWRYYTHLGTDCGRMGPGASGLRWEPGRVRVDLSRVPPAPPKVRPRSWPP